MLYMYMLYFYVSTLINNNVDQSTFYFDNFLHANTYIKLQENGNSSLDGCFLPYKYELIWCHENS